MRDSKKGGVPSASFVVGAVALLFLVIGYQASLFITKASVARVVANHDSPDTVFVLVPQDPVTNAVVLSADPSRAGLDGETTAPLGTLRGGKAAKDIWRAHTVKRCENFRFNPNTVSVNDLIRLGFSEKQAQAIDNYRKKGGRFRRKSDFAKSYVVADSVYKRLEKYIDIPKLDINKADSSAFETLPGIGKFYAAKMVSYRKELGGYSYPEQLMDIWKFDQERFDALKDLITVGPSEAYPLWTLPEASLAKHPYIGKRAAHGIVIFRENTPKSEWTVGNMIKAGILDPGLGEKLARCAIAPPSSP